MTGVTGTAASDDAVARLDAGEAVLSAWSTFRDPAIAEALARAGFDLVTLDLQHGAHDIASSMAAIDAVALAGAAAAARIPLAEWGTASRLLDAGARIIIAPMINSPEEARALVAATKFPPLGARSWGPRRAMFDAGFDGPAYVANANRTTLALAMIETVAALEAVDDILAVEGLDGVFVGPGDLSITLSAGAALDPAGEPVDRAIRTVAERAAAHGKLAGIFVVSPEFGQRALGHGFRLVALSTDGQMLARGAGAWLKEMRAAP